jgi:ABC-type bacteriocin/lantibiotic exporter with double-glycine peptidase domain
MFFQFNVKLFKLAGIIPSENINSSSWKSALFRIFQVLSLLLDISMITLQFIALYHYWGNLNVIAGIIAILIASVFICFIIFYTNIFRKKFCDLTESFETNSIFCSELVRSNQKHIKIVHKTLRRAQIYNKVISMFINAQPIFYILPTLVRNLMNSDKEILQAAETVDGFTK